MCRHRSSFVFPDQAHSLQKQCFWGNETPASSMSRVIGVAPRCDGTVTQECHSNANLRKRSSCAARGCGDVSAGMQRGIHRPTVLWAVSPSGRAARLPVLTSSPARGATEESAGVSSPCGGDAGAGSASSSDSSSVPASTELESTDAVSHNGYIS